MAPPLFLHALAARKRTVGVQFEELLRLGGESTGGDGERLVAQLTASRQRWAEAVARAIHAVPPPPLHLPYMRALRGLADDVTQLKETKGEPVAAAKSAGKQEAAQEAEEAEAEERVEVEVEKKPSAAASSSNEEELPLLSSRLERVLLFAWSNLADRNPSTRLRSARFEMMSVALTQALFLRENAARVLADEHAGEETRLAAYRMLLDAAALLEYAASRSRNFSEPALLPDDLHPQVLQALAQQVVAEAQEVTVATGVAKGTKPSLLARLARDCSDKFGAAHQATAFLEGNQDHVQRWRAYLELKTILCRCAAAQHFSSHLEAADERGPAIALSKSAEASLACAAMTSLVKSYTKGISREAATRFKAMFDAQQAALAAQVKHLERNNTIINYSRIPPAPPALPPALSLLKLPHFSLGNKLTRDEEEEDEEVWSHKLYNAFHVSEEMRLAERHAVGRNVPENESELKTPCTVM